MRGHGITSSNAERFELGNLVAERGLDTHVERHVRGRTTGTHAGQPYSGRISFDPHELDIAAVGL